MTPHSPTARVAPRPRVMPFGASLTAHAAVLLVLAIALRPSNQRDGSNLVVPAIAQPDVTRLVWLAAPGDAGGGGGGGNQTPEPPRRFQRPGSDRVSVPPLAVTRIDPAPLAAPPETPEQQLAVRALPLGADLLSLPGALESPSFSAATMGSGQREGAGTGNSGGIGAGNDRGLGPGSGGHVGDGWNGGNAGLVLPALIRETRPLYTADAMRAGIQGVCVVRAIVQTDGSVGNVQVIRSLDPVFGLDQAAVRAASQWRFRPGLIAGQPVPVAITIELSFNIR